MAQRNLRLIVAFNEHEHDQRFVLYSRSTLWKTKLNCRGCAVGLLQFYIMFHPHNIGQHEAGGRTKMREISVGRIRVRVVASAIILEFVPLNFMHAADRRCASVPNNEFPIRRKS